MRRPGPGLEPDPGERVTVRPPGLETSVLRPTPGTPEAGDVLRGLERILAGGDFDGSPRSRGFVRFIVEETLAGRQEGLTQAAIAVQVFGRRGDFDPTIDPIVRIQAGRLRRSLERYYFLAGADDPVRIELPRGGYVPVLRWARPGDAPDGGTDDVEPVEDPGGWPSIVLSAGTRGEGEGGPDEAAARFVDYLAVELDRYRDVHVVLQPDLGRRPSSRRNGATFALTGRLLDEDGHPRVAVRLVDCRTARQVWAEEYRGCPEHRGDFHSETARVVAARVASEQGIVAQTLCGQSLPPDTEGATYRALLRSYRFFLTREPADLVPALAALLRAVAAKPECALAWVQLSRLHVSNHAFEIAPADTSVEEGLDFAQNAVRLDPSSQRARAILACALLVKGETAASLAEAEQALALNPETFVCREWIGSILALLGDWERGTALVRMAVARNPHHLPQARIALWADHLRRGEFAEAYGEALVCRDAVFFWRSLMRASCLGHLGRLEEARAGVAELLRTKPDFARRGRTLIGRLLKLPDLQARVVDGLARAGLVLDGHAGDRPPTDGPGRGRLHVAEPDVASAGAFAVPPPPQPLSAHARLRSASAPSHV
jgi:adenylate cyclase